MNSLPSGFGGFRAPGQPQPTAVRTLVQQAAPTKRTGLVPMVADSGHVITIDRKPRQVTCRDRRGFPDAKGMHFCLHRDCVGKWWPTEAEMRAKHPTALEMANANAVHLHGFWSNDDCDPNAAPVEGCAACAAATAAATAAAPRAKGKDAPEGPPVPVARACDAHRGGAIGLLTPTDPNA